MRSIFTLIILAAVLPGCGAMGEFFPDFESDGGSGSMRSSEGRSFAATSIRPETLVACRGHVLVPAIGMTFVPYGGQVPERGQYLREESLTPPYRVLPPGAAATMDNVPSRLNLDLDRAGRVINIRCG